MHKLASILLLFFATNAFAQEICSTKPLRSSVSAKIANGRIKRFSQKNQGLFYYTKFNEISSIKYSKPTFLKLLAAVTKEKNYDGFRIYFATYPVKDPNGSSDSGRANMSAHSSDCFTLIYVPTVRGEKIPIEGDTSHAHIDQLKHCLIVKDDEVLEFDAIAHKFISQWISKYRVARKPYFGYDGNVVLNKVVVSLAKRRDFDETESLWYSKDILVNETNDGLVNYIKCDANQIEAIDANFAGYMRRARPWSYRLTLVFKLISKGNFLAGHKQTLVVSYNDDNKTTNADTGKPCPPPTGGCQVEGAVLPLQQ